MGNRFVLCCFVLVVGTLAACGDDEVDGSRNKTDNEDTHTKKTAFVLDQLFANFNKELTASFSYTQGRLSEINFIGDNVFSGEADFLFKYSGMGVSNVLLNNFAGAEVCSHELHYDDSRFIGSEGVCQWGEVEEATSRTISYQDGKVLRTEESYSQEEPDKNGYSFVAAIDYLYDDSGSTSLVSKYFNGEFDAEYEYVYLGDLISSVVCRRWDRDQVTAEYEYNQGQLHGITYSDGRKTFVDYNSNGLVSRITYEAAYVIPSAPASENENENENENEPVSLRFVDFKYKEIETNNESPRFNLLLSEHLRDQLGFRFGLDGRLTEEEDPLSEFISDLFMGD